MAILFIYKNKEFKMNIEKNTSLYNSFRKFLSFINENENNIIFLYKGKKLSIQFESFLNKLNNTQLKISVFNIKNNKNNNDESKYITCPNCNNLSYLNINNDNIFLDKCINNHKFDYIQIHEFIRNQEKIKCDICQNNKCLYNHNFYKCSCGKNICKLCLENHNFENHNFIEYSKRFQTCNKHEKEFISFCKDCKQNLCEECENEHYKHKIILYKILINKIKINEMKNTLKFNKERINEFKEQFDILNEIYYKFILYLKDDLEDYINLINKILVCLDNLNNYETIQNVMNFKLEFINININNFLSKNLKSKMIYLIDIFERYINEIDIEYEINKLGNEISLFSSNFVENNKNNSFIMINNKIIKLTEKYIINEGEKIKNLKIKLFMDKKVINISKMFYRCSNLFSLSDTSKWNLYYITDMSYMFFECLNLSSIPNISKWKINNVTNISFMFYMCKHLFSLFDISKWITNNVTNMRYLFYECTSLLSLPDISKWNTNKVTDMSYMFYKCSNLNKLPDISSWNTNNVTNISRMFSFCSKLNNLPDISKWNTSNITNMSQTFLGCTNLSILPFISIWNTYNLIDMSYMFYECSNLPKISVGFVVKLRENIIHLKSALLNSKLY